MNLDNKKKKTVEKWVEMMMNEKRDDDPKRFRCD